MYDIRKKNNYKIVKNLFSASKSVGPTVCLNMSMEFVDSSVFFLIYVHSEDNITLDILNGSSCACFLVLHETLKF